MKKNLLAYVCALTIMAQLLSPIRVAFAAYDQQGAQSFLLAQQSSDSPWVTMALAALGASGINSDYLKNVSGSNAINYEAPILAITALGQDPANFGAQDYVAKLKSFFNAGQIGDPTALNDDFFGILALSSAGLPDSDPEISGSKTFILSHQNSDGGWGWSLSAGSDSNDTAAAIMSLVASGVPASDGRVASALSYLKTDQAADGGFLYDGQTAGTDSSSTSWVVWALNSLAINPQSWSKGASNPISYLASYQNTDGSFKWMATDTTVPAAPITADAVIALAGKTLPLKTVNSSAQAQTFSFRIEGSKDTLCTGQTLGPTAMDIVKNASTQCGFSYNIQTTSYGPYLNQIGSDAASGQNGWVFLVNDTEPNVGAADYQLMPNDQVLWFFGDYTWLPIKLALSSAQTGSGQSVVATVEDFNNNIWSPLAGANVTVGTKTFTTDSSGQATVTNQDGYYQVFAQESGYIRSNAQLLQIGQPASGQVNLTASISSGQVQGTSTQTSTIAFSVNPTSLDFGSLKQNVPSAKQITITNTGNVNINVKSAVLGDSLFTDNLTIGQLPWQKFAAALNAGQNQNQQVALTLPASYAQTAGQKTGQLIFWAAAQ